MTDKGKSFGRDHKNSRPKGKDQKRKSATRFKDRKEHWRNFDEDNDDGYSQQSYLEMESRHENHANSKQKNRSFQNCSRNNDRTNDLKELKKPSGAESTFADLHDLNESFDLILVAHEKHFPHSVEMKKEMATNSRDKNASRSLHDHGRKSWKEKGLERNNLNSGDRFYRADGKRFQGEKNRFRNSVISETKNFAVEELEQTSKENVKSRKIKDITPKLRVKLMEEKTVRCLASNEDSQEVLRIAVDPESGFQLLLELENFGLESESVFLVLTVLGTVCETGMGDEKITTLISITLSNTYLNVILFKYLNSINKKSTPSHIASFYWMLSYMIALQKSFPSLSCSLLSIILPSIKDCTQAIAGNEAFVRLQIQDKVDLLISRNFQVTPKFESSFIVEERKKVKEYIEKSKILYSTHVDNGLNTKSPERKPMDFETLNVLAENDDCQVVFEVAVDPQSGFQQLLKLSDIEPDKFSLVLTVLGKSCLTSTKERNIFRLMNATVCNGSFSVLVLKFLTWLCTRNTQFMSLYWLLTYLTSFQQAMPANANELLSFILSAVKCSVENIADYDFLDNYGIVDTVVLLGNENSRFVSQCLTPQDKTQRIFEERKHALDPEENFRSISIFPTKEDLKKNEFPFIRPNLTVGKYRDIEHYLDVQFRLLREDFIRPLREGIGKLKFLDNKAVTTLSEFHIFRNVHILYPKCTPFGIVHSVQFDLTYFRNTNWEAQKRWLMPGSLLCLSKDNFETMYFAEVSDRDPKKLEEGLVGIRFDRVDDTLLRIRPTETFIMLETNAYFEAYRHNLRKLQKLTEHSMPFQDYLVHLKSDVKPPSYLADHLDAKYDLRPLMCPFPDKKTYRLDDHLPEEEHPDNDIPAEEMDHKDDVLSEKNNHDNDLPSEEMDHKDVDLPEDVDNEDNFPGQMNQEEETCVEEMERGKNVEVLNSASWPSKQDLNMDTQQYNAVKNALTKEFVIIQGPPGTGKSYVGLRIIQILLQNRHVWQRYYASPILVVCYTNHALDQFLEEVLVLTPRIVRVGGKCISEELEQCKLLNLRRERRERKLTVTSARDIYRMKDQLNIIRSHIDIIEKSIAMAMEDVISEKDLKPYMEHRFWESLSQHTTFAQRLDTSEDDEKLIWDWLGRRLRGPEAVRWLHQQPMFCKIIDALSEDELSDDPTHDSLTVDQEVKNLKEKTMKDRVFAADDEDDFFLSRHVDEDEKEFFEPEETVGSGGLSDEYIFSQSVVGGARAMRKYIACGLSEKTFLSSEEIADLSPNIWSLPLSKRWCLYRTWVARFVLGQMERMIEHAKEYQHALDIMSEMRREEDLAILKDAHVVGMTTTGAAKYQELVQKLRPVIVIAEEAAEVLEAHLVTAFCKDTQHLILIGDHQQLRPNPAVYELALKYKLDVSLFERLVKNNFPCEKLHVQRRMRPSICKLITPHIYETLISHQSVKNRDGVKGVAKSVYFVSHDRLEGREVGSTSLVNEHEAHFLIALCRYLLLQNYKPNEITILSTYSMQANLLKTLAEQNTNENLPLNQVHIVPVDSYQGNQNEIILISFVRSNDEGKIGFLSTENRICVALSRAKQGLFCIGNFQLLAEKSPLWEKIVGYLDRHDFIGPELKLVCQKHSHEYANVRSAEDFKAVPEGGCFTQCDYIYGCKHKCTLMCHPYDTEHKVLLCTERCNKKFKNCPMGHRCPKFCGDCRLAGSCGMCTAKVYKELSCFHETKVLCGARPSQYKCIMPCLSVLPCGHTCKNKCGEECDKRCDIKIKVSAPCCHLVSINCDQKSNDKRLLGLCQEKCKKVLECGHKCSGSCGLCFQGRFHVKCKERCDRQLVCGHICNKKCCASCPPCEKKCDNCCDHDKCILPCHYPCKRCERDCTVKCIHQKCKEICSKECSIKPCREPCTKTLKCFHTCTGFCGDLCPQACFRCQSEMKNGNPVNTRVIQLEQCDHLFQEKELNEALKITDGNILRPPCCPKCKTPIKSNRRCGNILKSYGYFLEQVKEATICVSNQRQKQHEEVNGLAQKLLLETDHSVQIHVERVNHLLMMGHQGVNMITMLKNILVLLGIVNECCVDFKNMKSFMKNEKLGSVSLNSIAVRIQDGVLTFIQIMLKGTHCSIQQLLDARNEVLRLLLFCTICKELSKLTDWHSVDSHIRDALKILDMYISLTSEVVENTVNPAIRSLFKMNGLPYTNLSEKVFGLIIRPFSFSVGHWRLCENAHVYGDCLRPFTLGEKCPECLNADI